MPKQETSLAEASATGVARSKARDGTQLLALTRDKKPELVVADIRMLRDGPARPAPGGHLQWVPDRPSPDVLPPGTKPPNEMLH